MTLTQLLFDTLPPFLYGAGFGIFVFGLIESYRLRDK
jgi:hypothetical protein